MSLRGYLYNTKHFGFAWRFIKRNMDPAGAEIKLLRILKKLFN